MQRRIPALGADLDLDELLPRVERDGLLALLDRLACGALLIGGTGHVLRLNAAARQMLGKGSGLSIAGGVLRALDPPSEAALRVAVDAATSPAARQADVVPVARGAGRRPLAAAIYPAGFAAGVPLVAVILSDPDDIREPDADHLRRMFGLTPAETRVARMLLRGRSPRQAALELGVQEGTVRAQLRQVLGKTRSRNQAELMRTLLGGVPPIIA